ncbi:biotin-(acetyl-CoA carboxylase) ligase [Candidatus Termititenax aidoneus]|uniref:biotin--[biotin carboxyl-carrier protein] ligase n=1 Tax=Termititenax aidoneus TaxID=2218524 RepID=A0A388TBR8_TERA1|nr:biotin-(acetyl-CoA carboxylase) ligase [Candidatus Termititenax aidoneus]
MQILWLDTVDSTNKYALAHLDTLADCAVIAAEEQTAGRGRLNRNWVSPRGENIYCSIVLKEQKSNPLLTVLAALAAAQTVRRRGLAARIKWPNDVLVNEKKICGVLAESNAKGLVIGIGVNINMSAGNLAALDRPATSLQAETGQIHDREKFLRELLENFFAFYEQARREGFAKLAEIWQNELDLTGKRVKIQTVQQEFYGTVIQIDKEGALLVATAQGVEKVLAGDVHVV